MSCSRLSRFAKITQSSTYKPILVSKPTTFASKSLQSKVPIFVRSFHSSFPLRNGATETPAQNGEQKPQQTTEGQAPVDPKDERIKNLEIQVEELKAKLVYSLAERENARLRAKKDVDNAKSFGNQSFAKDLLSVADNLSRCIKAVKKSDLESNTQLKELWEGINMTEIELYKTFKSHQLEKFEPVGLKFDPNTMNALAYFPDPTKEGGSVAEVLKTGYFLNGRLIRPADVAVVKPEPIQS